MVMRLNIHLENANRVRGKITLHFAIKWKQNKFSFAPHSYLKNTLHSHIWSTEDTRQLKSVNGVLITSIYNPVNKMTAFFIQAISQPAPAFYFCSLSTLCSIWYSAVSYLLLSALERPPLWTSMWTRSLVTSTKLQLEQTSWPRRWWWMTDSSQCRCSTIITGNVAFLAVHLKIVHTFKLSFTR